MKTNVKKRKNEKIKIAVFFGGCSPEYGVSLESAYAVLSNLNQEYYIPIPIGISRTGQWFYFSGSIEKIKEDTWHNEADCIPAALLPDRGAERGGKLLLCPEKGVPAGVLLIDAAFPVLHGKNGEDGTLQGLLELADVPIVGCGVLASALCMDKDRAHRLVQTAGVRVPKAVVLEKFFWKKFSKENDGRESVSQEKEILRDSLDDSAIGFPLYVKPVKAGSSFGVTKVTQADRLEEAIAQAFAYDDQVILEENIEGFEVGCAVLGKEELIVGEVDEIELQEGFFDFTEKYTLKTSAIHVPARISAEKAAEIKETAKRIYRTLGCSGFARVDMFLTPDGEIVFNEVNTIPGFTEHSRYPGMMKAAGYSFTEVLEKLIETAI